MVMVIDPQQGPLARVDVLFARLAEL